MYGEIKKTADDDNNERESEKFFWRHSYSKFFSPHPGKYTFKGAFMSFDHYNVESRERVKYITGDEGK